MDKHEPLFEFLPQDIIVSCVEKAFENLNSGTFGEKSIRTMTLSKQVICGIFHELIVNEISQLPDWYPGKQGEEADIVHFDGLQLQVKTSTSFEGIAGNRYSSQNEYSDPSEFYLCVNFIPFKCITKIRAGFVESDSWKPQTGKGNAATLSLECLNAMPFLKGSYIEEILLSSIKGIGKSTLAKLGEIQKLYHLKNPEFYRKAKSIIPTKSWSEIEPLLSYLK